MNSLSNISFEGITAVALVANGVIHDYQLISRLLAPYDKIIAVDGGLIHCQHMQVVPDLIIGDFDSIPQGLLEQYPDVPRQIFPVEKDETDLELAIRVVDNPALKKLGIFGALEKRTDHALGNLHLLRRFANKACIETELETLYAVDGKREFPCRPGQTVSLIPIGSTPSGVTTYGLKWELSAATLDKHFMSISNVCVGTSFSISIQTGDLICCLSR